VETGIGTLDDEEGSAVDGQKLDVWVEETEWKEDEKEVAVGRGGTVVVVAAPVVVVTAVALLAAENVGTETVTVTTLDTSEVGCTTEIAVLVTSTVAVATMSVTVVV
jgi:hypothetical protein